MSESKTSAGDNGVTKSSHDDISLIDAIHRSGERHSLSEVDWVLRKFREFFQKKGLQEVLVQHKPSILAACENPKSIGYFRYVDGQEYALPQTNQMWLEHLIMSNPKPYGYYCTTASFRFEKNPTLGRHLFSFPMVEMEIHGDFDEFMKFEREMLEHFKFGPANSFPRVKYDDACKEFGVEELTDEHEALLMKKHGMVVFLTDFPKQTHPFWNMKRGSGSNPTANKCDILLKGVEAVGSAERSCDVKEMRKQFHEIVDGQYAQTLFDKFGKDRVEKELEEFFQHKFITRSGAGIGLDRMIDALKAADLMFK